MLLPTGSRGDWGDSGKVIFPEQALGVGVGVFKRGIHGREWGPPAAGIPTPPLMAEQWGLVADTGTGPR